MNIRGDQTNKKIILSTVEGYRKDNTVESKRRFSNHFLHFSFTGNDAPKKAIRALMEKFGITKDEI